MVSVVLPHLRSVIQNSSYIAAVANGGGKGGGRGRAAAPGAIGYICRGAAFAGEIFELAVCVAM